jgi:hypothetical protein
MKDDAENELRVASFVYTEILTLTFVEIRCLELVSRDSILYEAKKCAMIVPAQATYINAIL